MQTTIPIPYIGVAGVTTPEQAEALAALSQSGRPVMIGVLASPATLAGRPSPFFPRRYARAEEIPGIFRDNDGVLNALHLGGCDRGGLVDHLLAAEAAARGMLDAIQLNGSRWPDPRALLDWREAKRESRAVPPLLVLQVSEGMIAEAGGTPRRVAARAAPYAGIADHFLLDRSSGTGKMLSAGWCATCAKSLRRVAFAPAGIGFAGGLKPGNIYQAAALLRRSLGAGFSLDMESGVRDEDDTLVIESAIAGVRAAYAALSA
jgi:phosphoribosylanthranilate isomerase